jgi:hypothetical protein
MSTQSNGSTLPINVFVGRLINTGVLTRHQIWDTFKHLYINNYKNETDCRRALSDCIADFKNVEFGFKSFPNKLAIEENDILSFIDMTPEQIARREERRENDRQRDKRIIVEAKADCVMEETEPIFKLLEQQVESWMEFIKASGKNPAILVAMVQSKYENWLTT